jgi:hypothetical protein
MLSKLSEYQAIVVAVTPSTTMHVFLNTDSGTTTFYVKRFQYPGLLR